MGGQQRLDYAVRRRLPARDKSAATGHAFTKDAGDGTVTDNADGTCTYTAPASGTGICYINCATDGNATGVTCAVAYGSTCINVGAITSFSASLSTGSWEITLRAYGDCTGLDRQTAVLMVVDDYWNGAADTFGGHTWAKGVFFGWVDRKRRFHLDVDEEYLEVTIKGPKDILNHAWTPDAFFSSSDTTAIYVSDFEAIDAAWIFIQESGLNNQINFHFMDDGQGVGNLKLEKGPMMEVVDDILARTFGLVTCSKLGDIFLQGDPDVRLSDLFNGTAEFTIDESLLSTLDVEWSYIQDVNTPTDSTVRQVTLEAVDGSLDSLVENWPQTIRSGKHMTVTGLICEDDTTLQTWAEKYYYKVNRAFEADLGFFLMHHVELLTLLSWDPEVRDLSNYDWKTTGWTGVYVSDINYSVDPGMGTWTGSVHVLSYYNPGS